MSRRAQGDNPVPTRDAGGERGGVVGQRALNRALLARQMLLERSQSSAAEALRRLVGMQAQAPNAPYVGLWTRLEGFHPDDLARLLMDRSAVRVALMRSTIHLVTADDCLWLRPLVQAALDRDLYPNALYGRERLEGLDLDEVVAAGRAVVEEEPRTTAELRELLGARWPDRDPAALAYAVRNLAALVQVPPRGIWGSGGQTRVTTAEHWVGRALDPDPAPSEMVLRYLAAFGPATVKDMQMWAGVTRLRAVVKQLGPRLAVFRGEDGAELFDLPDAPRPAPDTPAPVRFLPEYDNLLLSHADRTRVIGDEQRKRIYNGSTMRATFLVDGFVTGSWKVTRQRKAATLLVEPWRALSKEDRAELSAEGEGLLALMAPDADSRDIRFTEPS